MEALVIAYRVPLCMQVGPPATLEIITMEDPWAAASRGCASCSTQRSSSARLQAAGLWSHPAEGCGCQGHHVQAMHVPGKHLIKLLTACRLQAFSNGGAWGGSWGGRACLAWHSLNMAWRLRPITASKSSCV